MEILQFRGPEIGSVVANSARVPSDQLPSERFSLKASRGFLRGTSGAGAGTKECPCRGPGLRLPLSWGPGCGGWGWGWVGGFGLGGFGFGGFGVGGFGFGRGLGWGGFGLGAAPSLDFLTEAVLPV